MKAGVRVFLYEKGYLHAKTISIDSEICSIGSANIDIRSFSINYELNAVFYSEQITKELEANFDQDLAYCSEFDPGIYRNRGALPRFRATIRELRRSVRSTCRGLRRALIWRTGGSVTAGALLVTRPSSADYRVAVLLQ